jgi:hypothetical protein
MDAMGLEPTLHALHRYFFMGAGDWADALAAGLCQASPAVEPFMLHEMQHVLDTAAQVCALHPMSAAPTSGSQGLIPPLCSCQQLSSRVE